MITKSTGYQSSDGKFHASLEDAQKWELAEVIGGVEGGMDATSQNKITLHVFSHRDKIIDILTMKPNSLPKARKINGGTKKRAPKHIAAQTTMLTEPPAAPAA